MSKARLTLSPERYRKLKKLVLDRDQERCIICHSPFGLDAHHVIYRSACGDDAEENLVILCRNCHKIYAHGKRPKHWRSQFLEYLQEERCTKWRTEHVKECESFKR